MSAPSTETEHRPLSGWCSPGPTGSRAKHRGCRWDLCGCSCHDKKGRHLMARTREEILASLSHLPLNEQGSWLARELDRDRRPPPRPFIPKALRDAVYARDGYRCLDCGTTERLSLDHYPIPFSSGGPDTVENLRTLCVPCNSRKGARV